MNGTTEELEQRAANTKARFEALMAHLDALKKQLLLAEIHRLKRQLNLS
jgi:uncharacterized Tic20 family protein